MNAETDAQPARPRRDRVPRNGQRERVLQLLRDHDGALDAAELASRTGLHVTTVRFHLDALCDEELIGRTRLNRPGRGRPRMGYLALEGRLDYRVLAEVLGMELGQSVETRARRAQQAGEKWAARMVAPEHAVTDGGAQTTSEADADDALDRAALRTNEVFTRMGFAPELAAMTNPTQSGAADDGPTVGRERIIRLHACPIRDLARAHPEVGCGVHLGLLRGLLSTSAAEHIRPPTDRPAISAHLEPLVEPELCLARLVSE